MPRGTRASIGPEKRRPKAWDYDRLVTWAEQEDAALGEIEKESPLPHSPDRKALDVLCQEIVEGAFHATS